MNKKLYIGQFFSFFFSIFIFVQFAQAQLIDLNQESEKKTEDVIQVAGEVDVVSFVGDEQIQQRIFRILKATDWFINPDVNVDEGVVFLSGEAKTQEYKNWATQLAQNTQDVVATVNQMTIKQKALFDFQETSETVKSLFVDAVHAAPRVLIGFILLIFTLLITRISVTGFRNFLSQRIKAQLLRDVLSRAIGVPIFLFGVYLALKISGLTGLAATIIGGTGLFGLIIGFAFRDIAENFLASILISIQRPFAMQDLIEVAGFKGFVQSVNARSTLLMTADGNHVQIPNAVIYKETIVNYTANPNVRYNFAVGIGYDDSLQEAQNIAMEVLKNHPAVIDDPEPQVLIEELGAATVNLRIYFWVNIAKYGGIKVKSVVIKQIKYEFEKANISMPDEAREVVFPDGVPVQMITDKDQLNQVDKKEKKKVENDEPIPLAQEDLESEAEDIKEQAQNSRIPEGGQNLLESDNNENI